MTKDELIKKISSKSSLSEVEVFKVIDIFIEQIKTKLDQGEKIEIPGFGNFTLGDTKSST